MSEIGQFLSKDSRLPNLTDEGKENRYAYVSNAPPNYEDRDGQQRRQIFDPIFFPSETIDKVPQVVAPNEPRNWTDDPKVLESIIKQYQSYFDEFMGSDTKLSVEKIKAARSYAFKRFATDNATYPQAAQWLVRNASGSRLGLNTVTPSNLGIINWDWLAAAGHWVTVVKKGKDYMFDAYFWAKSKWNAIKATQRFFKLQPQVTEEIGPPQDLTAMFAGEMLRSGEISIEHLLNPSYRNELREHINRRQFTTDLFLPLVEDKNQHHSKVLPPISNLLRSGSDSILDESRLFQSKDLTDHIMSQMKVMRDVIRKHDLSGGLGQVAGPGGYASPNAYAALRKWRNLKVHYPPNVGGVYLDKAAEVLGELSSIEAATFDPVSNRLLLIGADGNERALLGLRLDHIAAAFRSVYGDYLTEPGVSIDPKPDNPLADEMNVKFFGGMENTHFGYFLFEADRMMKSLSLGEDNISHQKVKTSVPGYYNLLSLSFSNLAGTYNEDLWSRFWLVPERVIVNVSPDGKTITFPDTRIRVKTETMRWDGGKLVPAVNEKDDKAEYFAAHFSKNYDKYAEEFPMFEELKKLANLVALAKWLRESGKHVDLAWLKNYETAFETPSTTPSYTVSDKRPMSNNAVRKISIFGGTDLSVQALFKKSDSAAEYGSKVLKAVSAGPEVSSKLFIDTNQEKKRVVVLPTSQTRAPGSKYLRELELEYLPRVFSSFHNGTGPFGHSWAFDIPHLDIGLPQRGKTEYVELKGQRVIVRTFRLARPFGLQDVKFRKHTVDQQHGRVVFLPGKQEGIRGLYPDEETNQFRVEYYEGMSETYDAEGRLIRRDYNSTSYLEFSYKQDGKIKGFKAVFGEQTQTWSLSYDSRGRVASAKGPEESWNYGYDEDNNLVQVTNGTFSREYRYDEKHLVTQVLTNSQVISTINYDKLGRIKSEKTADGRTFEPKIESRAATFIVRDGNGKNKAVEVFDPAGRILDVRNPSGAKISWNYDKIGNVESIVRTNRFGDANTYEYSSDARLIKHTNPEQDIRAFLFDEFGRLKQVQNRTSALLNKTYNSTDRGWLEETETPESKIQVFFDNNPKKSTNEKARVKEVNIVSKNVRGGQIIATSVYDDKGKIQKISTKGSIKTDKLFEDGRG